MPTRRLSKALMAAGLTLLIASAPVDGWVAMSQWTTPALIALAVVNVVVSPPGTTVLRALFTAAAVVAAWAQDLRFAVVGLAWLIWPAAFLMNLALARERDVVSTPADDEQREGSKPARMTIAAIIGAVAIGAVLYRWLLLHQLGQTAALFIGVPAILAIVTVITVSPRSGVGVAIKAVTVGLLVSMMLAWEGVLCIAMSAPLFYAVAVAFSSAVDHLREERERAGTRTFFSVLAILLVAPMSLEGVIPLATWHRDETVSITKVVRATPDDVARALDAMPRFDRGRPLALRMGFPSPTAARRERSGEVDRWTIEMRGGETRLNGMEPRSGDLVLERDEVRRGFVHWRAVSDSSHMTHFLNWNAASVEWSAIDGGSTRVTWTLEYRRGLDPGWYFGPMERYAVGLAAGYLIDSVATP